MNHLAVTVTSSILVSILAGCAATAPAQTPPTAKTAAAISRADVETAQRAWCDALVAIGAASAAGEDAAGLAMRVLSTAYDYDGGGVLFKPTLTHGSQTFRMDKQGALAYFVGGDPSYPDDSGFARKQWVTCEPKIAGVVAQGDMAIAMGNVYLTDAKGNKVMVDKSFGYRRDREGSLKILLHHSSLPYTPANVATTK